MEFTPEQIAALLDALGLPADTTDTGLVVATAQDLAAQAAGINAEKPSTIAAAARKAGLEVVDTDTLTALKADAAEGLRVAAAAAKARVEAAVDDAVDRGKITPGRRKHWVELITADPGMADVLASVPDETAVPLAEVGHAADKSTGSDTDPVWFY